MPPAAMTGGLDPAAEEWAGVWQQTWWCRGASLAPLRRSSHGTHSCGSEYAHLAMEVVRVKLQALLWLRDWGCSLEQACQLAT